MVVFKVIPQAELAGVELFVHRGEVYFQASSNREAQLALEQIEEVRGEVWQLLMTERGADAGNLI